MKLSLLLMGGKDSNGGVLGQDKPPSCLSMSQSLPTFLKSVRKPAAEKYR